MGVLHVSGVKASRARVALVLVEILAQASCSKEQRNSWRVLRYKRTVTFSWL